MNPKRIFPKFLQILTFHTEKGKEGGGGEKDCLLNNNRLPQENKLRQRPVENCKAVAYNPHV